MSQKTTYPTEVVLPVALALIDELGPFCTRIALTGSLRRGELAVGDVEIVCCPAGDALEGWFADAFRLRQIAQRHKTDGSVLAWGERYKAMWLLTSPPGPLSQAETGRNPGIPVDVFMVLGDRQWGPTYLLRTGPGEANDCLVTRRGIRNRMGRYGVLPEGLTFGEGAIWREGETLDTPEEVDVYRALDWPYVPPVLRSYETYQALRWGKPIPTYPPGWAVGDDCFVNGKRRLIYAPVAAAGEETLEQGRLL